MPSFRLILSNFIGDLNSIPVALFTNILTIKNCRKCKTKITKSFTKILTIIFKGVKQFTVSAFSLTVWQTLLHILIYVYWNKSGLIQTDALHNIVVNSSLARLLTESITIYSVHLHFQCNKVYCLHIIWHKIVRIILCILDFKIGNGRQSKRLLANLGRYSSFSLLKKKIDKNTNTGFSSRHLLPLVLYEQPL